MQLLYRALNELDIACNPLKNGLASKKLIYELTLSYLQENEKQYMKKLNQKEQDEYCKQNMLKYINTHQHKLKKMIDKQGNKITTKLQGIEYCNPESWTYLLYYLSSLNAHLNNGSKIYTDWISSTKNLNSLKKYLEKQTTHKIAVLATNSEGIADDKTIVIDLSTKQTIKDIIFMLNKKTNEENIKQLITQSKQDLIQFPDIINNNIFENTNEKFVGFNYATKDKETCIYRYYPSERIISVLEQLQIDLIAFKLFNFEYLSLDKNKQLIELNKLKETLKQIIINKNDPYMLHIFNEIYINNKNIELVKENIFEKQKINQTRIKILQLTKNIPNIQIKK